MKHLRKRCSELSMERIKDEREKDYPLLLVDIGNNLQLIIHCIFLGIN